MIVAILVFIVAAFFVHFDYQHLPMAFLVISLVSALFSLAGFTNAMLARNFDDIAIVPTFILAPLTYLGGVFYTTEMLSSFWQKITLLNPIYYMVNALRHVMTDHHEINMQVAMGVIVGLVCILATLNLILLKKGVGLRE